MRSQTLFLSLISLLVFQMSNIFAEDYSNWQYSKDIVLNTADKNDVDVDINNLPILIHLDKNNFNFNEVSEQGAVDIRFSTSSGAPLPYYVEEWDSKKEKAQIWVIVNVVYCNSDNQYIVMYWGNDNVGSESNEKKFAKVNHDLIGIWNLKKIKDLDEATKNSGFKIINKTKNENKKFNINKRWSK